jgi:hypothetical protein
MDYSLELFELYLATCWTNLSDVLDYTYTCWAEAPKLTPPQERSVRLLDAMRASCEIAAQAEEHLIIAKRPRRYEGHFASTGTRNSKVRTLLFLRIRRGNLLTFGICWTILGDFLESRRLLMDFWDSRRLLVDFWDYTWRLFGLRETFSRFWDYTLHPFVNGFVGPKPQNLPPHRSEVFDCSTL